MREIDIDKNPFQTLEYIAILNLNDGIDKLLKARKASLELNQETTVKIKLPMMLGSSESFATFVFKPKRG